MKDEWIKNRWMTMKRIMATAALALGASACSTPPTTVEALCERADECNILDGSVGECVENRDRCVDGLTESQRRDWERMIDDCLDLQSCPLAFECYQAVPWC